MRSLARRRSKRKEPARLKNSGGVSHAEDGLEAESEPPDLAGPAFWRHVGEHESRHAGLIDRFAVVGTIQTAVGQANRDASSVGHATERIGPVLDQLEQLAVGIASACCVLFEVGMFEDKARLVLVGRDGPSRLLREVGTQVCFRSGPIQRHVLNWQIQLGVRAKEPAALTRGEVVLGPHLPDSYCRRSCFAGRRAEMIRTLAALTPASRYVWLITINLPFRARPSVTQRSSVSLWSSSGIDTANGSLNTVAACSNAMPCLRQFPRALTGSQSKRYSNTAALPRGRNASSPDGTGSASRESPANNRNSLMIRSRERAAHGEVSDSKGFAMAAREKFSSQVAPELLAAMREIARSDGRHFQSVLEDAMTGYIETRARQRVRPRGDGALSSERRAQPAPGRAAGEMSCSFPERRSRFAARRLESRPETA